MCIERREVFRLVFRHGLLQCIPTQVAEPDFAVFARWVDVIGDFVHSLAQFGAGFGRFFVANRLEVAAGSLDQVGDVVLSWKRCGSEKQDYNRAETRR